MNSKAGALDFETTLRGRLARGEPLDLAPAHSPSFRDFAPEWLALHAVTNNRPSTVYTKEHLLRNHLIPAFGKLTLNQITTNLVEQFKARQVAAGLSPKSVNNQLTTLRACLHSAEEWGHATAAPKVRWLKIPPQPFTFLSPDESERLLKAAGNSFWRALILCGLRTGMRLGELIGLDWTDVDLDRRMITVRRSVVRGVLGPPKSNRMRHIPIAADLLELFAARSLNSGLVFPGYSGSPLPTTTSSQAIHRACKRAGLPQFGWHALRHTFASQLVAAGVPIRTVQVLLGHSTVAMTERYAHLAPSSLTSAVEVLVPENRANVVSGRSATAVNTAHRPITRLGDGFDSPLHKAKDEAGPRLLIGERVRRIEDYSIMNENCSQPSDVSAESS